PKRLWHARHLQTFIDIRQNRSNLDDRRAARLAKNPLLNFEPRRARLDHGRNNREKLAKPRRRPKLCRDLAINEKRKGEAQLAQHLLARHLTERQIIREINDTAS